MRKPRSGTNSTRPSSCHQMTDSCKWGTAPSSCRITPKTPKCRDRLLADGRLPLPWDYFSLARKTVRSRQAGNAARVLRSGSVMSKTSAAVLC